MIGLEIFGSAIQTQEFKPNTLYNCFNSKLTETEFVK
jgi:hypothetical protein